MATITYHDGSEPTSSSSPLQSHPGDALQGPGRHVEFTLRKNSRFTSQRPGVQVQAHAENMLTNMFFPVGLIF